MPQPSSPQGRVGANSSVSEVSFFLSICILVLDLGLECWVIVRVSFAIYVGTPSDQSSILKNSLGFFEMLFLPTGIPNTPYGNIYKMTNAAAAPMVIPCQGAPPSVDHEAATRVTPQQQGRGGLEGVRREGANAKN